MKTRSLIVLGLILFLPCGCAMHQRATTAAIQPVAATAQPPSQRPAHPAWKHELAIKVIDDGKWDGDPENARQVMLSAAGELWKYFPDRKMPRIEVYSKGGPFFYYGIGDDAHAKILLAAHNAYWAQMAYQFAHEYCHLLCHFGNPSPQHWFQETLCETASRFALRRMSETWKTSPPYPNWKDYSGALRSYFDNLQNNNRLPPGKTLAQWYRENSASCTYITPVVAGELFEMLDAQPEHWEAVTYYPHEKLNPDTFEEFLRVWQRNCPEKHKAFIAAIAAKFEYDLSSTPAPARCGERAAPPTP
jgi:hypothetical protein